MWEEHKYNSELYVTHIGNTSRYFIYLLARITRIKSPQFHILDLQAQESKSFFYHVTNYEKLFLVCQTSLRLFENRFIICFIINRLSTFCSRVIQIIVDTVYTGRKSPTNGMNSARFIMTETLLLVIEYNKPVTMTSNMSPSIGTPKMGAAKQSRISATIDIPSAITARILKNRLFCFFMDWFPLDKQSQQMIYVLFTFSNQTHYAGNKQLNKKLKFGNGYHFFRNTVCEELSSITLTIFHPKNFKEISSR